VPDLFDVLNLFSFFILFFKLTDVPDLFDVLRASCNWPFFLARSPLVRCRQNLALDGYFVAPRTLGCLVPMANAQRTIAVSAFPSFAVPSLSQNVPAADLIDPNMDGKFPAPPEGLPEWLQSALQAYSPARAHELFEMGRRHGDLWIAKNPNPSALAVEELRL